MPAPSSVSGTWRIVAPGEDALAEDLSKRLGLHLVQSGEDWRLVRDRDLWRLEDREGRKLTIDFDEPGPDYHRRAPRGRGEILARALGAGQKIRRVADLTAGLGQDAVFLSQLGFQVTAVERHPVLGFLLAEARRRTLRKDLANLIFKNMDSKAWLDSEESSSVDVAYFDPMYPSKKKSALPRQEMVLFRGLVGDDEDAAGLARFAIEKIRRLVIKRPLDAEALLAKPTASYKGKTVRYDVYVR